MQILYHGSHNLFDKFSFQKVGTGSGTSGAGFGLYFTTSQADATSYGEYIYTVSVQLRNALSNTQITLKSHIIRLILVRLLAATDRNVTAIVPAEPTSEDEFDEMVQMLLRDCVSDTEIIQAIINEYECHNAVMQIISNLGYSHSCDYKTPKNPTTINYCIYDLDVINIIRVDTIDTLGMKNGIDNLDDNRTIIENISQNNTNKLYGFLHKHTLDFSDLMEGIDEKEINEEFFTNLNEEVAKGAGGKAKSKSQRRFFLMAKHYKEGKLDPKVYAGKPELEAKLKRLSTYDSDVLAGYTNTFQKKRKKDGTISKHNAIPDRVKKPLKKKKKINKLATKKAKELIDKNKKLKSNE
jgi:hypothetical protein